MPDLTTKPMTYDQAMTILRIWWRNMNDRWTMRRAEKEYDDQLAVDAIKSTTPAERSSTRGAPSPSSSARARRSISRIRERAWLRTS